MCLHHEEEACILKTKLCVIAYTKNKWLIMFLRTFGRGRPPIVAPRSINLFYCNKFRLQGERRPLAEGPKQYLSFARIANHSNPWGPPICGALSIYIEGCVANIFLCHLAFVLQFLFSFPVL
jgi:hypothetical protein